MISFTRRLIQRLRRRFLDAPRGLGHPVPASAFDREYDSGHWDLLFGEAELPRNRVLLDFVVSLAPRPAVLDIGCGSGRLAQLLAPHRPSRYVGLDLSSAGLRRARALGLAGCEFIAGDFETWRPTGTDTFDTIIFNESIGYARDPRSTLRAFAPYLRPNGLILVSYFRSGNHRALWQRIAACFTVARECTVRNARGQAWDIRALHPRILP